MRAGSRTLVSSAQRPARVTPSQVPPPARSRPPSQPSSHHCAGAAGRAWNSSRLAAITTSSAGGRPVQGRQGTSCVACASGAPRRSARAQAPRRCARRRNRGAPAAQSTRCGARRRPRVRQRGCVRGIVASWCTNVAGVVDGLVDFHPGRGIVPSREQTSDDARRVGNHGEKHRDRVARAASSALMR